MMALIPSPRYHLHDISPPPCIEQARETDLPQEQARVMALRQEVFRLKEAALTTEERAMESQDELQEMRQQVTVHSRSRSRCCLIVVVVVVVAVAVVVVVRRDGVASRAARARRQEALSEAVAAT